MVPAQETVTEITEGGRLLRSFAIYGIILIVFLGFSDLSSAWLLCFLLPSIVLGLAWWLGRRDFELLELGEFSPVQGFSGQRMQVHFQAHYFGRRPLRDLSFWHGKSGGKSTVFAVLPYLQASEESSTIEGLMVLPSRGRHQEHVIRLRSQFPWGLWQRSAQYTLPTEIISWPRLGTVRALDLLLPRVLEDRGARPQRHAMGNDFHGLEEWRPGLSLRQVHWKSTAHRGKLMIRLNEGERQGMVTIQVLPPLPKITPGLQSASFERSLSLAASLGEAIMRKQVGAILQVDDVRGAFRHQQMRGQRGFYQLLNDLTEVQLKDSIVPGDGPPPLAMSSGQFRLVIQAGAGTQVTPAGVVLDPIDPLTRRWFREERGMRLHIPTQQRPNHWGEARRKQFSVGAWTEAKFSEPDEEEEEALA